MFTEKHLCWNIFFDEVAGLRPTTLFKKTPTQGYLMNMAKFLRTTFL